MSKLSKKKLELYDKLVNQFQQLPEIPKFKNPHTLWKTLDKSYPVIDPWELWHNNLEADILVIGQDWACEDYFVENFKSLTWEKESSNPTNIKLKALFEKLIGTDIGLPSPCQESKYKKPLLFFTNAVMGIKEGNKMDAPVGTSYRHTSNILERLINIIKPKYIIILGKVPYKAVYEIYKTEFVETNASTSVRKLVEHNGNHPRINKAELFVMFHPSTRPVNRTPDQQSDDWDKVGKLMRL